jgi:hypothetical protein
MITNPDSSLIFKLEVESVNVTLKREVQSGKWPTTCPSFGEPADDVFDRSGM